MVLAKSTSFRYKLHDMLVKLRTLSECVQGTDL